MKIPPPLDHLIFNCREFIIQTGLLGGYYATYKDQG